MTLFSDNIYSGFIGLTSAQSSNSEVLLSQSFFASAGAGANLTYTSLLPPGAMNINAAVYVVQQGAATTNDNIVMWINGSAANGQRILSFTAIGSAANQRYNPTTYIASAAANPQPPATNATNGGEIPFKVIVSSVSTAAYQVHITFNRADTYFPARG